MIIETRRWQVVMFIFGLFCLFFSVGTLINLKDIYVNICLQPGSQFYYYLNQTILITLLVLLGVLGSAFLYAVFYSIRKCHEFRASETKKINFKKVRVTVLVNGVIIILFFAIFFIWDSRISQVVNGERKKYLEANKKDLQPSLITFKCKVLAYKQKDKYTEGKWIGLSEIRINSPERYKGIVASVKVFEGDTPSKLLKTEGEIVTFYVSFDGKERLRLQNGMEQQTIFNESFISARMRFFK